jgi:hypothetical protein
MTGIRIPRVCGTTALAAALALISAGCAATSSSTAPAAPASSASLPASASASAASVSPAATATASPAASATTATSPTAMSPTATAAVATPSGAATGSSCTAFAAGHTFLHLNSAKENADGTLTVTGVAATMICGGPDDFHYNFGTAPVTGHVVASATIRVLNSALQPTPIKLAKFPSYLGSDMNVRVFTYNGPRSAITALTEQFHP